MPKVKKIRAAALQSLQVRQEPLGQVLEGDESKNKYAAPIRGGRKQKSNQEDEEFLDPKTSKKILDLTREQQLQMQAEEEQLQLRKNRREQQSQSLVDDSDDEEQDEEIEEESLEDDDDYIENDQGYVNVKEGTIGLTPEDEAIVASMMGGGGEERKTLADIIMEKIAEKEAEQRGDVAEDQDDGLPQLPEKVVEVYTDIGKILARYTSGKLPKAFKVIPSLSNWEQVLYLTRPDLWSPQAMFAATRIFASNLNPKMAQRFYNLVLLDAVRADIMAQKKLNYHYYMSLKKAVYKPAAFFKGILLPLCKEECTLREAAIIASVLQRVSIPVHHSAVAIHKLAQLTEYNGAASIFIKTLLNKKYSLPAPVIKSLVRHFAGFINDDSEDLPVLWHQALLAFVERYKNEVQDEARESLRLVMKKHFHYKITPEIRRELFGAQAWKDERSQASQSGGGMSIGTTSRDEMVL